MAAGRRVVVLGAGSAGEHFVGALRRHGCVELESSPGQGATFTIVIPVDQPRAARGGGA